VAAFAAATVAAIVAPVAGRIGVAAAVFALLATFAALPWIANALPRSLDGAWRRRRVVATLWAVLALIGVLQMARLSAFMADESRVWGATVPDPAATNHACMSAYVYAADLSRRGVPNLYDASWYPLFDPPGPTCRLVSTGVAGLPKWAADPYQYPPPFLLLPRIALAITSSYATIRGAWFVIQALALLAAGVLLARWVGGPGGLTIGLLIPAVLASIETMFNLQWGQFHALAFALAVGAMTAFEKRRDSAGGALLAAAILSKIFPAILLLVLAAQRRWRALAWTAGWSALLSLAALAVLGPQPFVAFARYQVPRIASGAAFHFTHEGTHEIFLLARNFSVDAIGAKLQLIGAPRAAIAGAHAWTWIYTAALLVLAVAGARIRASRVGQLMLWLGLLNLAAFRSPMAPSAYALAPVLWVLVLLATRVHGRPWPAAALVATWVLVVGPPPLPNSIEPALGIAFQLFAVAVCGFAVAAAFAESRAASLAASRLETLGLAETPVRLPA
jgi:hypothetical protein